MQKDKGNLRIRDKRSDEIPLESVDRTQDDRVEDDADKFTLVHLRGKAKMHLSGIYDDPVPCAHV